jgi:hypothetical protein
MCIYPMDWMSLDWQESSAIEIGSRAVTMIGSWACIPSPVGKTHIRIDTVQKHVTTVLHCHHMVTTHMSIILLRM